MYHLPPHAFACLTGQCCAFLDLRRDSYHSVPRQVMEELAPWIHNSPIPSAAPPPGAQPSAAAVSLACELSGADLLREGPPTLSDVARVTLAAQSDLESMEVAIPNTGHSGSLCAAAAALLYAHWALRALPIFQIIDLVRRRKRLHSSVARLEMDRVVHLTKIFAKFRPHFPRNYLCLFDSLALILFLSRYNLHPDWVFGVQEDPFSAHCWVQADTLVLNDHFDNVASYTPIMTV